MAGASASGLNPHLPVGTGVAVRKGDTTRPGGAEKGGDVGGKSSVLSQWPEHRPQERREGWRSRGVPSCHPRRLQAPTLWRPSRRAAATRFLLPTPPLPAQSPKRSVRRLRASRASPQLCSLGENQGRRLGLLLSRSELGEFVPQSSAALRPLRGAAARASKRQWRRNRWVHALPGSAGLRYRPQRPVGLVPVLSGQLPTLPAARHSTRALTGRRAPAAAAHPAPRTPPVPVLRLPRAAAHLEAAPAPPWRLAPGRHLLPSPDPGT